MTTGTTIQTSTTLAELVTTYPLLARELERRGLDYCCGGTRTLGEASASAGLDPTVVADELSTLSGPPAPAEWASLDAAALCDHLEQVHHTYLRDELPRLSALLEKIRGVHGERHPELAEIEGLFAELRADLEPHLLKEEQVLFPAIRRVVAAVASGDRAALPPDMLDGPLSVMEADHDVVGELLARLRTITRDYAVPADGCASYAACFEGLAQLEADTHQHVHKENNRLFVEVRRLLTGGLPAAD